MAMGASVNTFNQPEALWLLLSIPLYLWLSRRSELLKRKAFTGAFLLDTSRRNETGHLWRAMNLEALMTSLWLLSVVLLVAQPRGCSQTSVLLTDGPVTDVVAQEFEHIYRVGASPYAVDDYRKVPFVHGPRNWQHARATIAEKFPGADCFTIFVGTIAAGVGGVGVRRAGEQWFLAAQVDAGVAVNARAGGDPIALTSTFRGVENRELTATGPIVLTAPDRDEVWTCGRGVNTLKVASESLPLELSRAFMLHPDVAVAEGENNVVLGKPKGKPTPSVLPLRRLFVDITPGVLQSSATIRFSGRSSPPAVTISKFTPLKGEGQVLLFGDSMPLVEYERYGQDAVLRFGFSPSDSQFIQTPGWAGAHHEGDGLDSS